MKFNRDIPSYREYIILISSILISLVLLSLNDNKQIEYFKMWMLGMLGTVQEEWAGVNQYFYLTHKNKELQLENMKLALENSSMYEIKLENERLKNLIGFRDINELNLVAARVIGRETKGFINDIVLDVGRVDSVYKNMPLVNTNGLVGKLFQVGKNRSIGHLLLDQNFRVSAKIQRSRVRGIVGWEGGDFCILNEVPKRSDVKIGDWVITSGYGEIFPPGLKIGRVISVSQFPRGLFMKIKLRPMVNFNILEEVFVINHH